MVKVSSGQHITDAILETAARIKKTRNSKKYTLKFRWAVGHVGIKENEEAGGEAKKAADDHASDVKVLPPLLPLKHNKSALRQNRKELLKNRWKKEWDASTRAGKYHNIDSTPPSNKYLKLISDNRLSRADASRIFQLRTGHIPLNAYLERFKLVDSAKCPACGHPKENV